MSTVNDAFSNYFERLKNSLCKVKIIPKKNKTLSYDKEWYFTQELLRIVTHRFYYDNLPCDLTSEIVEYFFTMSKFCVFHKNIDDKISLYRANMDGKMNIYNIALSGNAYADNGVNFNFNVNDDDIVLFYDNLYQDTDFLTIQHYADILNQIYIAYRLSINNQKVSRILACNKNTLLSAKNLQQQIDNGEKVIYIKDTAGITDVKDFDLSSNYNCDKLKDLFRNEFKEFLNRFGIEDFANDSRERLVSDEVHATDNYIELNRNIPFSNRLEFIKKVNKKFGSDIKVHYNSNLATEVNKATTILEMLGGGLNE